MEKPRPWSDRSAPAVPLTDRFVVATASRAGPSCTPCTVSELVNGAYGLLKVPASGVSIIAYDDTRHVAQPNEPVAHYLHGSITQHQPVGSGVGDTCSDKVVPHARIFVDIFVQVEPQ